MLNRRVVEKRRMVTVSQIRAKIQKRNNEEVMKVQIALDHTIATKNCKVQAVINAHKKLGKDMFKEAKGVLIACKKFQVNWRNFYRVICKSMGNR